MKLGTTAFFGWGARSTRIYSQSHTEGLR